MQVVRGLFGYVVDDGISAVRKTYRNTHLHHPAAARRGEDGVGTGQLHLEACALKDGAQSIFDRHQSFVSER